MNRHPAIYNKLATKHAPKPNLNPTLTLPITLTLMLLVPKKEENQSPDN